MHDLFTENLLSISLTIAGLYYVFTAPSHFPANIVINYYLPLPLRFYSPFLCGFVNACFHIVHVFLSFLQSSWGRGGGTYGGEGLGK